MEDDKSGSVRMNAKDSVGVVTSKKTEFEMPPPGAGFDTVMKIVPGVTMSDAKIVAVTLVLLTPVVARGLPFHFTTSPLPNPAPFTVSVNPGPPGAVAAGTTGLLT